LLCFKEKAQFVAAQKALDRVAACCGFTTLQYLAQQALCLFLFADPDQGNALPLSGLDGHHGIYEESGQSVGE